MVKVILDESQFGNIVQDKTKPIFAFYRPVPENARRNKPSYEEDREEEIEFITWRYGDGKVLVAVTKKQYKNWKKSGIYSEENHTIQPNY